MDGLLMASRIGVGNSKWTSETPPLLCPTIFTKDKNGNAHHSNFSLPKMLYSITNETKALRADLSSLLSLRLIPDNFLIIPRSMEKLLASGLRFSWSLAIRISAFMAFLCCNVVTLFICTRLLCFLISMIALLSSKSEICLLPSIFTGKSKITKLIRWLCYPNFYKMQEQTNTQFVIIASKQIPNLL